MTVNITDKANIANETQRSRTSKEDSGITDFIGAQTITQPNKILPGRMLTTDSTSSSDGKGSVNRQEALQTNVAAVVTQVLPNGNLVVEGKQEIRVNFEIRELIVAGIVRPEDIQSDNTIDSSQDRAGPHRLWRPRPDHRRAAAPLRPAGDGRAAAVLSLISELPHLVANLGARRCSTRPPSAPLAEAVVVFDRYIAKRMNARCTVRLQCGR